MINDKDIVTSKPLKLLCDSSCFLDVQIMGQSDDSNNFCVKKFSPAEIELSFDYVDAGEGVALQILHTYIDKELSTNCKIKGGKKIRNCQIIRNVQGLRGFLSGVIEQLAPLVIALIPVLASAYIVNHSKINNIALKIFVLIIVMSILFVFIMVVCYIIKKRINKVFHRKVPSELKKMCN